MSDFNSYDAKEYAIELLENSKDSLVAAHILKFINVSELEAVEMWAEYNNCIDSEQALSESYDEMLEEIDANYGEDYLAFCEDFNNTTDAWCSDGLIHSLQYDSYCYVGKHFKSEQ
tara:strand:- start:170 stop:517 length:348 start_codon:yes stop_codon:yes gene_type:complete